MEKKQVYIMEAGIHPSTAGEGAAPTPPADVDLSGEAWYLVGTLNGWSEKDTTYPLVKGEKWLSITGVVLDQASELKLHTNDSWSVNRGGSFVETGAAIDIVHDGPNLAIPAGTYDIYMNFTATKLYVMAPGEVPAE
jgi:hypothetical protein